MSEREKPKGIPVQPQLTEKGLAFLTMIIGSVLLTGLAALKENPFAFSPLVGLAVMFFLGTLPRKGENDGFMWMYVVLLLGSLGLLMLTVEQVYWTTPLVLGVVVNVFGESVSLNRENQLWFFVVLVGTMLLSILAANKVNQFWPSPLVALLIMFFLGGFPDKKPDFYWVYSILIIGSLFLLMRTSEQVYWTTPVLVGVLLDIFNVNIDLSGLQRKTSE